uniref:Uncharacterized protein n=1 Tax=Leersia perrieri TaxID=77586 RepID=A0A0D9X8V0_9ORYZ
MGLFFWPDPGNLGLDYEPIPTSPQLRRAESSPDSNLFFFPFSFFSSPSPSSPPAVLHPPLPPPQEIGETLSSAADLHPASRGAGVLLLLPHRPRA